jgi:hypothetical protein
MYRGSTFLLQRTYTVHVGVVEGLAAPEFARLWVTEVGTDTDPQIVDAILAAVSAIMEAYTPSGTATDTLATKVLLGTLACLPAVDRFFVEGFQGVRQAVLQTQPPLR